MILFHDFHTQEWMCDSQPATTIMNAVCNSIGMHKSFHREMDNRQGDFFTEIDNTCNPVLKGFKISSEIM